MNKTLKISYFYNTNDTGKELPALGGLRQL